MVVVVGMCWRRRHGFGSTPEHRSWVVHVNVHVLVATPVARRHGTKPGSGGGEDGSSSRQTGRQLGGLREVRDVHVHVDIGLVEAGNG